MRRIKERCLKVKKKSIILKLCISRDKGKVILLKETKSTHSIKQIMCLVKLTRLLEEMPCATEGLNINIKPSPFVLKH